MSTCDLNNMSLSTEKYLYYLDCPHVSESACIEISEQKITVIFPEKKNFTNTEQQRKLQNILLFINNQLKFSSDWLPCYTENDFLKIKDMLSKCYSEFLKQSNYDVCDYNSYKAMYYDSLVTCLQKKSYSLNCYEDYYNTSIEISISKNEKTELPFQEVEPVIVEFFIGTNQIFCSRDLYTVNMSANDYNYLLNCILFKLLKCS